MTVLERYEDLVGCTIVHVDRVTAMIVVWSGASAFLEYTLDVASGKLHERSSWSAPLRPGTPKEAVEAARDHYGVPR